MRTFRGPLAFFALLAASCTDYTFGEQEILLRHDAESDVLELLVVSEDLQVPAESALDSAPARARIERARDRARGAARGDRFFVFWSWPWQFDLEELAGIARGEGDPLADRALPWMEEISVEGSGLFRGEDGRVHLWQRARVPRASEGLGLLDEAIAREILEAAEAGELAEEQGWADPRTVDLWEESARATSSWLSLEEGALVLRVPLSAKGAAGLLAAVLEVAAEIPEDPTPSELASCADSLEVADGRLVVRWRPGADGWVRLRLHWPQRDDAGALRSALAEGSEPIPRVPPDEQVARLVD